MCSPPPPPPASWYLPYYVYALFFMRLKMVPPPPQITYPPFFFACYHRGYSCRQMLPQCKCWNKFRKEKINVSESPPPLQCSATFSGLVRHWPPPPPPPPGKKILDHPLVCVVKLGSASPNGLRSQVVQTVNLPPGLSKTWFENTCGPRFAKRTRFQKQASRAGVLKLFPRRAG